MCGGGSTPKPPVQPKVQPPPVIEATPEVAVGNQSEGASKRRRIGRSELRQAPSTGAKPSGLGS